MQRQSPLALVERGLGAAALVVGRVVTRAAGLFPKLVAHASGLEDPSPEAALAGVVRGVTALAPASLAIGGRAVDLLGAASVLAVATWTVKQEADGDEPGTAMLASAIASVEQRGLCGARTAALWRLAVRAPLDPDAADLVLRPVLPDVRELGRSAAWSLSRKAAVSVLGSATPLFVLDVGLTVAGAWRAMGDAARLVDAAREHPERDSMRDARAPMPAIALPATACPRPDDVSAA